MLLENDTYHENSKKQARSIWDIWSHQGPRAYEFGAVIPLPDRRLAFVPISENGFEIEGSTYLREDHPIFTSHRPTEPLLIPYSAQDVTNNFIDPKLWEFLAKAIDKKKEKLSLDVICTLRYGVFKHQTKEIDV